MLDRVGKSVSIFSRPISERSVLSEDPRTTEGLKEYLERWTCGMALLGTDFKGRVRYKASGVAVGLCAYFFYSTSRGSRALQIIQLEGLKNWAIKMVTLKRKRERNMTKHKTAVQTGETGALYLCFIVVGFTSEVNVISFETSWMLILLGIILNLKSNLNQNLEWEFLTHV